MKFRSRWRHFKNDADGVPSFACHMSCASDLRLMPSMSHGPEDLTPDPIWQSRLDLNSED